MLCTGAAGGTEDEESLSEGCWSASLFFLRLLFRCLFRSSAGSCSEATGGEWRDGINFVGPVPGAVSHLVKAAIATIILLGCAEYKTIIHTLREYT